MGQMDLKAIGPKAFAPRTTQRRHTVGYNENLLLDLPQIDRINHVWVGDVTYITVAETFAYFSILMDRYSRKIVGWSMDMSMDASLLINALKAAIKLRQPAPGLIHHSDRGGQYAAILYRQILKRAALVQTMSRAADCYDNAFMESCFGTIKSELEMTRYESFSDAYREIENYFNYYNTIRRHSSLDYLSPN